jgi:hypothetical protein
MNAHRKTSRLLSKMFNTELKAKNFIVLAGVLGLIQAGAAEPSPVLWRVGQTDRSAAEFALAQGEYSRFLQRFGSPDRAFYIGLSDSATDWPCVLPGLSDEWAGSGQGERWDQMNTLPIGFVLEAPPSQGVCRFVVDVCDAQAARPPRLRVTVNGAIYEVEIPPGGGDQSIKGDYQKARAAGDSRGREVGAIQWRGNPLCYRRPVRRRPALRWGCHRASRGLLPRPTGNADGRDR